MKEKPILFSGEMVRAILEGRKTQTRRIVKFTKWMHSGEIFHAIEAMNLSSNKCIIKRGVCDGITDKWNYPYGAAGDRLWVRETWCAEPEYDMVKPSDIPLDSPIWYRAQADDDLSKWRPSIFMPRWASRITLEITNIRVERLQDISKSDAISEGVKPCDDESHHEIPFGCVCEVDRFKSLWDSINADRAPWESNPWVFVIEFKKLE